MPQSCTSNDIFPPNTPGNIGFFLESTKNQFRNFGSDGINLPMFGFRKLFTYPDNKYLLLTVFQSENF
jgi:hypothetical protein